MKNFLFIKDDQRVVVKISAVDSNQRCTVMAIEPIGDFFESIFPWKLGDVVMFNDLLHWVDAFQADGVEGYFYNDNGAEVETLGAELFTMTIAPTITKGSSSAITVKTSNSAGIEFVKTLTLVNGESQTLSVVDGMTYEFECVGDADWTSDAPQSITINGEDVEVELAIYAFSGLTLTANQDSSSVKYVPNTTEGITTAEYSTDGVNWSSFDNVTVDLDEGESIFVRGEIKANQSSNYARFVLSGSVAASGNINSLYVKDGYKNLKELTFEGCYANLFYFTGCLTSIPELPEMKLSKKCYFSAFSGNPISGEIELSSMELAPNCYSGMLAATEITKLHLPALHTEEFCYSNICQNCTSLTEVEIDAVDFVAKCALGAFNGCTALEKITTYVEDVSATMCTRLWLENAAATGDFYNLGEADYTADASGIPSGWTEHTSL